jgi:tetratricopeptide (TPR) repeat protein
LAIWITGFAFVFYGRTFFQSNHRQLIKLLKAIFWITLIYVVFWITYGRIAHWSYVKLAHEMIPWKVLGKTINMAAIVPMLLFPLIGFQRIKRSEQLVFSLLGMVGLYIIISAFKSNLSIVLAVFYGLAYLLYLIPRKRIILASSILLVTLIGSSSFWIPKVQSFLDQTTLNVRIPHERLVLKILQDHPINGLGLGSYFYEANTYLNLEEKYIPDDNNQAWTFETYMARNHNNAGKLLAEIGPIAWMAWITPVFLLFFYVLRQKQHYGIWVMLAGFYISCLTLRPAFSDYIELSEVHLLFFLALIVLPGQPVKIPSVKIPPLLKKVVLGAIMGVVCFWLGYNFLTNHYQLKAIRAARNQEFPKAINYLEPWYRPGWMETINEAEPIARHLARWYKAIGNEEKAAFYYQQALKLAPMDGGLRFEAKQAVNK